ncbi:immunity protein 74 of polymorphic toxin system [Roseimicrobium gellanilyticum]|uniref:Immunity protein 74 of polymorphic toxin system n=1 Tax=Roseimicrobium gellanilyticum TaxID=748857 RepID=A0A366HNW8_9BACT|nr:immunity protein 74 of polymorphic toxin system [Roseimicrobium gellanilyticum]
MFSSPRPNLYKSTEGFSVEVLGRTGILYSEAGRTLRIDSEVLSGASGMVVYKDSINHWQAPHHIKPFSLADRERVIENVRAAFKFQGYDIVITWPRCPCSSPDLWN